jgi:flagellin
MGFDLTNVAALGAAQAVSAAQAQLQASQARISTGLKVASAKDDGATWQIAETMRGEADDWRTIGASLARGQSTLDVAASAAQTISDLLSRIRAKALAYLDAGDAASQAALQQDIQTQIAQVDDLAKSADFNGVNLVNGATASTDPITLHPPAPTYDGASGSYIQTWSPNLPYTSGTFDLTFDSSNSALYTVELDQSGVMYSKTWGWNPPPVSDFVSPGLAGPGSSITVETWPGTSLAGGTFTPDQGSSTLPPPPSVLSDPSGDTIPLQGFDLTATGLGLTGLDFTNPQGVLAAVESAGQAAVSAAATFGGQQTLMAIDQAQASHRADVLTTGVGNLVDADLGKEAASLQAGQIKQTLAIQALAIANATPKALLSLYA